MAVIRRIYKQGNSWVVSIPPYMFEQARIDPVGRTVKLEVTPGMWITIQPHKEREAGGRVPP